MLSALSGIGLSPLGQKKNYDFVLGQIKPAPRRGLLHRFKDSRVDTVVDNLDGFIPQNALFHFFFEPVRRNYDMHRSLGIDASFLVFQVFLIMPRDWRISLKRGALPKSATDPFIIRMRAVRGDGPHVVQRPYERLLRGHLWQDAEVEKIAVKVMAVDYIRRGEVGLAKDMSGRK